MTTTLQGNLHLGHPFLSSCNLVSSNGERVDHFSSVAAAAVRSASDPASVTVGSPSQAFCDACNAACCLMNGRQRKLQVRYEGFLLVKRVQGFTSSRILPCNNNASPTESVNIATQLRPVSKCCNSTAVERRHSCSETLEAPPIDQVSTAVRSVSQISPNDLWEKLVNVCPNGGTDSPLLNNNLPAFHSDKNTVPTCCGRKISPDIGKAAVSVLACSNSHQRLSRKKSRSQDNLTARKARLRAAGANPVLNNCVVSPTPSRLLHTSLSLSEGNIHNVTGPNGCVGRPWGSHGTPVSENGIGGIGGFKAEVEELARLPRRLLDRVSDEVGQMVANLGRWREEYIILTPTAIAVKNNHGKCDLLLSYSEIEEVMAVTSAAGSCHHQHSLVAICRKSSLLMQASTSYVRDQWLHTIQWMKNAYKYKNLLETARRPEVLLKELKNLVQLSLNTPLHDPSVFQVPLELASSILTTNKDWQSRPRNEEIIMTLAPLLENTTPSSEICSFFSKHCADNPRSTLVTDMFSPVVARILKHNVDFGKYRYVRGFVRDFIQALSSQNAGTNVLQLWVWSCHGHAAVACPHPLVLNNLAVVCTSAIYAILREKVVNEGLTFDENVSFSTQRMRNPNIHDSYNDKDLLREDYNKSLQCYITVLEATCEFDDWRPGLADLLHPVPFPDFAFKDDHFLKQIASVILRIGTDPRCEVHQTMLEARDQRRGWIDLINPTAECCPDKGKAWIEVLEVLISCCCKRKKFLKKLLTSLSILISLKDNSTVQDILCLMLEWDIAEKSDDQFQMIETLQSTPSGKEKYQALYDRQINLHEMQQKCGPRKLTLPNQSTDGDFNLLFSSGPFGNLESLSLAFTRVTSACAEQLIHLPTLKSLNLWGTQFDDKGLIQICEHLHNLQVLNLCETPVTDKGVMAISALKKLRILNLNSTQLTEPTFEHLKKSLPLLTDVDVKYTDAW